MTELAVLIPCADDELVGVFSLPEAGMPQSRLGVLIVVGGPQYRVGSHRQFVLLARYLAQHGLPCLRFDYRGMGDATGALRDFEQVDSDIRAAIDAFYLQQPDLTGVVLWGLCDGATAAAFYAPQDARVRGLLLLNPWVKTAAGEAQAYLKHYYLSRLLSRAFWKKLLAGGVNPLRSLCELQASLATVIKARMLRIAPMVSRSHAASAHEVAAPHPDKPTTAVSMQALPVRLRLALQQVERPWQVLLSGRDYVAREFEAASRGTDWKALSVPSHTLHFPAADHTFSSQQWRDEVAQATLTWVRQLNDAAD